jgi:hypothetical protein
LLEAAIANHPASRAGGEEAETAGSHTRAFTAAAHAFYNDVLRHEGCHPIATHALDVNTHLEAAVERRVRVH